MVIKIQIIICCGRTSRRHVAPDHSIDVRMCVRACLPATLTFTSAEIPTTLSTLRNVLMHKAVTNAESLQ